MKRLSVVALTIFILFMTAVPSFAREAGSFPGQTLEGYIKNISDTGVEIEEYSGFRRNYNFTTDTVLRIDGIPAEVRDFKPGMEVYAKRTATRITYMESFSTENPGFISPGEKVRSGVVKKIDRDQLIVGLLTGKDESYYLTPATIIIKNGEITPATTLYEGDNVRLYFDDKDTTIISRLHIQSDSVNIKDLYRGTLDTSNTLANTLVLKNVEVFRNGLWREYKDIFRIEHNQKLPLFMDSRN